MHLVKKTFEGSTQDFPGVSHELAVMHRKSEIVIFPSFPDPMRNIRRNKDNFMWTYWRVPMMGKIPGG